MSDDALFEELKVRPRTGFPFSPPLVAPNSRADIDLLVCRTSFTHHCRQPCVAREHVAVRDDGLTDGLPLQLIATLLLDYDPEDKGSLGLIKTSLRLLADETPEAEPYFYPSSDEGDDPVDSDDVRRMLASWSLESSTTTTSASGGAAADSWPSGSGSNSSDSASLNGVTSSREDNLEFLKMLFPYASVRECWSPAVCISRAYARLASFSARAQPDREPRAGARRLSWERHDACRRADPFDGGHP